MFQSQFDKSITFPQAVTAAAAGEPVQAELPSIIDVSSSRLVLH